MLNQLLNNIRGDLPQKIQKELKLLPKETIGDITILGDEEKEKIFAYHAILEKNKDLEKEKEELTKELESRPTSESLEQEKEQKSKLETKLEEKEKELNSKLEELNKEKEKIEKEKNEIVKEKEELSKKTDKLENKLERSEEKFQNQANISQAEWDTKLAEIVTLNTKLVSRKEKIEKLRERVDISNSEWTKDWSQRPKREELEQVKEELLKWKISFKNQSTEEIQESFEKLENNIKSWTSVFVNEEPEKIKQQIQDLQTQNQNLQKRADISQEKLEKDYILKSKVEKTSLVNGYIKPTKEYESQINELQNQRNKLKEELIELKEEIALLLKIQSDEDWKPKLKSIIDYIKFNESKIRSILKLDTNEEIPQDWDSQIISIDESKKGIEEIKKELKMWNLATSKHPQLNPMTVLKKMSKWEEEIKKIKELEEKNEELERTIQQSENCRKLDKARDDEEIERQKELIDKLENARRKHQY